VIIINTYIVRTKEQQKRWKQIKPKCYYCDRQIEINIGDIIHCSSQLNKPMAFRNIKTKAKKRLTDKVEYYCDRCITLNFRGIYN